MAMFPTYRSAMSKPITKLATCKRTICTVTCLLVTGKLELSTATMPSDSGTLTGTDRLTPLALSRGHGVLANAAGPGLWRFECFKIIEWPAFPGPSGLPKWPARGGSTESRVTVIPETATVSLGLCVAVTETPSRLSNSSSLTSGVYYRLSGQARVQVAHLSWQMLALRPGQASLAPV
jgi:hypothetical protein